MCLVVWEGGELGVGGCEVQIRKKVGGGGGRGLFTGSGISDSDTVAWHRFIEGG